MILTGEALRITAAAVMDPTPEVDEASVDVHVPEDIVIEPHSFEVVNAVEELTMPGHVAATITGRSCHMRDGVTMPGGFVDPTFDDAFALEFFNHSDEPYIIEAGEAGGRLTFMRLRDAAGVEPRFWSKVDVRQPSQCWEWEASHNQQGYGQFRYAGTMRPAHQVAFALSFGPAPDHVLHKCDNRSCVNPSHLYNGTNMDNVQDRVNRGNQLLGEDVPVSKLNEGDAEEIRERYESEDVTQQELAEEYDISQSNVSRVINGERRGKE